MKVVTKTVTKEETFYMANDGTLYEDEEECFAHEMNIIIQSFNTYDCNFNHVDIENCDYVIIENIEELNNFKKACTYIGITADNLQIGLNHYDWSHNVWEKIRFPSFFKKYIDFFG